MRYYDLERKTRIQVRLENNHNNNKQQKTSNRHTGRDSLGIKHPLLVESTEVVVNYGTTSCELKGRLRRKDRKK